MFKEASIGLGAPTLTREYLILARTVSETKSNHCTVGTINLSENCTSTISVTSAELAGVLLYNWGNLNYTSSTGIMLSNEGRLVNQVGATMNIFSSINNVKLSAIATSQGYFDNYGTVVLNLSPSFSFRFNYLHEFSLFIDVVPMCRITGYSIFQHQPWYFLSLLFLMQDC